jgi:hypothetical protein
MLLLRARLRRVYMIDFSSAWFMHGSAVFGFFGSCVFFYVSRDFLLFERAVNPPRPQPLTPQLPQQPQPTQLLRHPLGVHPGRRQASLQEVRTDVGGASAQGRECKLASIPPIERTKNKMSSTNKGHTVTGNTTTRPAPAEAHDVVAEDDGVREDDLVLLVAGVVHHGALQVSHHQVPVRDLVRPSGSGTRCI